MIHDLLDEVRGGVVPDIRGHGTGHRRVGGLDAARLLLDGGRGLEATVADLGEDDPGGPLGRPDRLWQPRHRSWPLGTGTVRTFKVNAAT